MEARVFSCVFVRLILFFWLSRRNSVYWCTGRTQTLNSYRLARSCHTHTNFRAAYRCRRVSRYGDYHYYHQWVSDCECETECDRRRSPSQQLRFPLGSTEALVHDHQGGFQKISNSKPWRTDVNKGEASSESWLLKEELEIWPNYGKRDDRMFTFKSRSRETIQFFSDR